MPDSRPGPEAERVVTDQVRGSPGHRLAELFGWGAWRDTGSPVSVLLLPVASVLAVVCTLYSRTWGSYFLADDFHSLIFARSVLAMTSVQDAAGALLAPVHGGAFLRIGGRIVWVVDMAAWELNPFGYHLTNTALHVVASLLVYSLTYQIARRRWTAVLASVLFAAHPLCVEPIAWLSGRNDLLCACFYLGSVLAFALYSRGRKGVHLCASLVSGLCALLAKEMAISLPAAIALYDLTMNEHRGAWCAWIGKKARLYLPYTAVVGSYLAVRWLLLGGLGGYVEAGGPPSFVHFRPEETFRGLLRILGLFLLPVRGRLLGLWGGILPVVYLVVFALFLLSAGVFLNRRRPRFRTWMTFGALWMLITLIPVHNLLILPDDLRNARYLYLSLVGPSVSMAFAFSRKPAARVPGMVRVGLAPGALLVFTVLTFRHCDAWVMAGGVTQAITDQLQALHPDLEEGARLHFVGIPDSAAGAYVIIGNTIDSAVRIQYPDTRDLAATNSTGSSNATPAGSDPGSLELGSRDLVLKWDGAGRLEDATYELSQILDQQSDSRQEPAVEMPGWDFTDSLGRKGWLLTSGLVEEASNEGGLRLMATTADPYLHSPLLEIDPTGVSELWFRMSATCPGRREGVCDLFWQTEQSPEFDTAKRARIQVDLDGQIHTYSFDLGRNLAWLLGGRLTGLRLDPLDCAGTIRIEAISFVAHGTH